MQRKAWGGTLFIDAEVSVTQIKNYSFCPVIPWIEATYNVHEPESNAMKEGKKRVPSEIAQKIGLERPYIEEVMIVDKELGVKGKVDLISGKKRLKVLEVKSFKRSAETSTHFRDQLFVYSLLVQRQMGRVVVSYLYLGGDIISYDIGKYEIERALKLINDTKRVVLSEEPPKVRPDPRKCSYCWYRHMCPYHW
ncbi:MAG: CRISPR-associated protein Cas4 [Caldisphaeraceae archaeon]|nr:CRISPR-associated protein Cas4 [Caldisphaeraceae archaeon]